MSSTIIKDKYFILIVCFKIILLGLFSSVYFDALFTPFLHVFTNKLNNPWQYFLENNLNLEAFPYHALMLYILAPFHYISEFVSFTLIKSLINKLPLLLFDIGIYIALNKLLPFRKNKILLFYFLNPIILYAIYIHAQLDIIPTAILLFSILFLHNKKILISALFFGLAMATKGHIILTLPLFLLFIYRTYSFKQAGYFFITLFAVFILIDLPFLFSDGFIKMVLLTNKQSLLFDFYHEVRELKIWLPILTLAIVYFHFFYQKKVNFDLFLFYIGILYGSVLFFTYPYPAWYTWLVPFIAILFSKNYNQRETWLLHISFSFFYIVFFIFLYKYDYPGILFLSKPLNIGTQNTELSNLFYTLLEANLLIILYWLYIYGKKSNALYSQKKNLVIGISGDSATGKTALMKSLKDIFGTKLLELEGDGEHKWERNNSNWKNLTHLDPKANYIYKQADFLLNLKNNKSIYRSEYNHNNGKFTQESKVNPKPYIIISGLHSFYLPKMRKTLDLKIYMDTSEDLRRHWKIIRDIAKRSYTKETILEQIEARVPDAVKFIHPQKYFADIVVHFFSVDSFKIGDAEENLELGLKVSLNANIHIEGLVASLNNVEWDYNDDLLLQYIVLKKEPTEIDFKKMAYLLIDNIDEIISENPIWENGYNGFIQLIALMYISEILKSNVED